MGGHLGTVGEERTINVAGRTISLGRRRPSGDPSPLGRNLSLGTIGWLGATAVVIALWASAGDDGAAWWFGFDQGLTRWAEDLRTGWLVDIARAAQWLGSGIVIRTVLWLGVAVLALYRRWRHLFLTIGTTVLVQWSLERVAEALERPRPDVVEIIGRWEGYSHPAVPVAGLTVTLVALGYSLLPPGRLRARWFAFSGLLVGALGAARLVLGVDHVTDSVFAAIVAAAAAVAAFRLLAPEESFPVSYSGGKKAHLDVRGMRAIRIREALETQLLDQGGGMAKTMRNALRTQLGCEIVHCEVLEVAPFGLAGSGGSTPLRVTLEGRFSGEVFAKLYATNHLRSDRWYKLGRAILYGRLEDERPFSSVRRLVEYEDYMLRVMYDAGIPSPRPHGVVQLVPGREFLVATEFFEGAREIDQVEMTEEIIDDALGVVAKLWEAGIAHRDIKPANVLVQDGKVRLIDVAFGEIRPSAWRMAVDLANMMLLLALRSDAATVYERAVLQFSERDIAEAFAATRGLTMPSQLRSMLRERVGAGEDLLAEFRALAPECPPIAIQRWGLRRIGLAAGTLAGALTMAALVFQNLRGVDLL
ncbi:MAG: RIO1 family regulatory kinase/ATPase [Acidimicrobiia bacterium]